MYVLVCAICFLLGAWAGMFIIGLCIMSDDDVEDEEDKKGESK